MERGKYIRTSEIRERASKIQKGRPSSFKGKHHTSEAIALQRLAALKRDHRGPRSQATREKIGKAQLGSLNHSWKGGFTIDGEGRVVQTLPTGKKRRARVVIENALNRTLLSREIVHHINEVRTDDRIENLFLFRHQSAHMRWHHFLRRHGLDKNLLISNLGGGSLA